MPANPHRVALVTGGSRGIGRAVVEGLLADGWLVYFCGRTQGSVDEAVEELRGRFGNHVAGRVTDVRQEAAVQAFVDDALSRSGRIDCLVNNAGVGIFAPVYELSGEAWREVIETNLSGAFYAMRAVAPAMRKQGRGWIFNIASLAARNPFASGAAYNASKFGMVGLSEAAMLDLRHQGIRVAAILPGSVDTEFGIERRDPDREWMLAPDDVARVVMDLLRFPDRALPSLIEIRPSQPPRR